MTRHSDPDLARNESTRGDLVVGLPAGLRYDGGNQDKTGLLLFTCKGMELMHILSSFLVVFSWIIAAILIFFLFLIGRFYEIRFGQKSYYQLMSIPLVLFVAAAVWDAFFANSYTGDPLLDFVGAFFPDLLFFAGGLVLIVLCYYLFRTMMGGRR